MELAQFVEERGITSPDVLANLQTIDDCFSKDDKLPKAFVEPNVEGFEVMLEYCAMAIKEHNEVCELHFCINQCKCSHE